MRGAVRQQLEAAPKSVLIDALIDLLAETRRVTPKDIRQEDVALALYAPYKMRKAAIKKRREEEAFKQSEADGRTLSNASGTST